jgi:hypothetical protein
MDFSFVRSPRVQLAYKIFCWANFVVMLLLIGMILHKSPAPVVERDPNAAARVEQKFETADQAKAQGQPSPQVQLDGTELNSYLAENLQLPDAGPSITASGQTGATAPSSVPQSVASPAGSDPSIEQLQSDVRDVKIDMEGDLIKAYVIFNVHGEDLSLELEGHLSSENGYLKFDPVSGKIGSLPLPQSALDAAVNQLMSSAQNRDKLKLPDDISDIQIQNGEAVVSYK